MRSCGPSPRRPAVRVRRAPRLAFGYGFTLALALALGFDGSVLRGRFDRRFDGDRFSLGFGRRFDCGFGGRFRLGCGRRFDFRFGGRFNFQARPSRFRFGGGSSAAGATRPAASISAAVSAVGSTVASVASTASAGASSATVSATTSAGASSTIASSGSGAAARAAEARSSRQFGDALLGLGVRFALLRIGPMFPFGQALRRPGIWLPARWAAVRPPWPATR